MKQARFRSADKVTKSQVLLLLAHVCRLGLSIVITAALGRLLSPADFGFLALISSFFLVAMVVLDLGTATVATRKIAARPDEERETLETLLSLRRLIATLLVVMAAALALTGYLEHGKHRFVLVVAAIGVYLLHFHAYQVVYQVRQAYGQAIAFGLGGQFGFLLASVGALKFFNVGGGSIALLVVAREIAQAVCVRWVAIRMLGYRLRTTWRHPGMWSLLKAGWMLGVAGVCYKLAAYSGGFFLWGLASPEATASYSASQRLLVPMADMAWLFVTPLLAAMSAAAAHGAADFRTQIRGYAKFLLHVSATVAVCGYFLAPFLLRLLYGDQYASGTWSSVGVFRWLSLAYVFALVTPVLVTGETAQGHSRALMYTSFASLALNAALSLLWVPVRGAEGAAMALCASEAFAFVVLFGRSATRGDMDLDGSWIVYFLPAALLAVVLMLLDGSPVVQFAVACVWASTSLLVMLQLPAQKACRASLGAVSSKAPQPAGPLAPSMPSDRA